MAETFVRCQSSASSQPQMLELVPQCRTTLGLQESARDIPVSELMIGSRPVTFVQSAKPVAATGAFTAYRWPKL